MRSIGLPTLACSAAVALAGCGGEPGGASASRPASLTPPASGGESRSGLLHGRVVRLNGEPDDLARYRGRVVLVVNTASECINTPQYGQLEALYRAHRREGLVVLGFPANDFAGQEPGTDAEIAAFCRENFGVSFPMFAKSAVTGQGALPLFRRLADASLAPSWNFTKYLVDRRGRLVERFDPYLPADAPRVRSAIERLL